MLAQVHISKRHVSRGGPNERQEANANRRPAMSGLHGPPLDAAAEDEWLPQVPQQARACFSVWAHGRLKGLMCLLLALDASQFSKSQVASRYTDAQRLVVVSASLAELPEEICELTNLKQQLGHNQSSAGDFSHRNECHHRHARGAGLATHTHTNATQQNTTQHNTTHTDAEEQH